jgi:hypothetical protein
MARVGILENVIATRTFTLSGPGRKRRRVTVSFAAPQMFSDGRDARCEHQILGLGDERIYWAGGIDLVQALELALKMAAAQLMATSEYLTGRLSWLGRTDLGLPLLEPMLRLAAEAKEASRARKARRTQKRRAPA